MTGDGSVTAGPAVARWRRLVEERLAEADRPPPGSPEDEERLASYADQVEGTGADDPFLDRVLEAARPGTTILDVGAGSGRFALPLLRRGHRVVAVEPRQSLVARLRDGVPETIRHRLVTIGRRWEELDPGGVAAPTVICSYVLPAIPDVTDFLRRLDAAARERVLVYLDAGPAGEPPTHLDLLPVLDELGLDPVDVEIVARPSAPRARWRRVPGAIVGW